MDVPKDQQSSSQHWGRSVCRKVWVELSWEHRTSHSWSPSNLWSYPEEQRKTPRWVVKTFSLFSSHEVLWWDPCGGVGPRSHEGASANTGWGWKMKGDEGGECIPGPQRPWWLLRPLPLRPPRWTSQKGYVGMLFSEHQQGGKEEVKEGRKEERKREQKKEGRKRERNEGRA